ncbi:hypothetical protein GMDG_06319 [Pseudogymnoascus destructans 20631-21]|uniref:Xylanolytic transcriptional activator regulatory domain-containing protein n=2 Tax=Pseudogymnoascus destructans TaxID=655981 RepID=L8FVC3_PSED2|nr:hypothetical protein GMDG_06319 [Pseudogymnoascus destructans 20631-21]
MRKAQPDHDAILSDTRINPDASLAETEPATLSTHLENDTLGSAAFESTGLDCTSLESTNVENTGLSSTLPERTLFQIPGFVNVDMNSVWGLHGSPSNAMFDQTFISDWLDGDADLSPPKTVSGTQQVFTPTNMQHLGGCALSDLMKVDLDELYFDRVYQVAPNIHRRNYFASVSQNCPSPARIALQYAMRAVAAAVSAQYRPLSSMLCAESRRVLEQMDADGAGDCGETPIEQIQAWLLVAHWELLCKHEHQAMLTAGRGIRMVQLARFHDVDACSVPFMSLGAESPLVSPSLLSGDETFAQVEEKRRTFWLAYCFDRFCLMRSGCPLSLQEDSIRTRLPAPEENFHNSEPIRMGFLPEALARNGCTVLPPFAKCVVLNSLFSRCMSYQRFARAELVSAGADSRKSWFALALEKRKQLLVQSLPDCTDAVDDPMLTFAYALAACAAIYVYQAMAHSMAWTTVNHESADPAYEEQALQAASELAHFVKMIPRSISHFKTHPFLPTLIHQAAVFLMGLPGSLNPTTTGHSNRDDDLNTLLGSLRNLQQTKNLSRCLLTKLEQDVQLVGEQHISTQQGNRKVSDSSR